MIPFDFTGIDTSALAPRDWIREHVEQATRQINQGVDDGIRQKLIDAGWAPPRGEAMKAGAAREVKDHQVRQAIDELVRIVANFRFAPTCLFSRDDIRAIVLPLVGRMPTPRPALSDAELCDLATKHFPRWREDIQEAFVVQLGRAVLDAIPAAGHAGGDNPGA